MAIILGIDDSYGYVYEGESNYGAHLIWPLPIMTPAAFSDEQVKEITKPKISGTPSTAYYFREDLFDPVSRIRRGRFYKSDGSRTGWSVMPSPHVFSPGMGTDPNGMQKKTLSNYRPCFLSLELEILGIANALINLGNERAFTIWSIIHIEAISTGEEMVTLKARQSMGVLPKMNWNKVPDASRAKVREELGRLENEFHKAGSESIIDRAREAATAILSAWLQANRNPKANGKDLGDLVKIFTESQGAHQGRIIACAAEIPQRLHSRGKHAEKEKRYSMRPIREQDAELAVQCIGTILCDLGWAEWR